VDGGGCRERKKSYRGETRDGYVPVALTGGVHEAETGPSWPVCRCSHGS